MPKLTAKSRKKIPSSKFGLSKERKYPMQDKAHAANAKGHAQQQFDDGKLSKSKLELIDKKANKVLVKAKKKAAPVKGKSKRVSAKKKK